MGKPLRKLEQLHGFYGELSGLYPSKDEFAAAKVDEVIDLATDITNQMRPALREKDP